MMLNGREHLPEGMAQSRPLQEQFSFPGMSLAERQTGGATQPLVLY